MRNLRSVNVTRRFDCLILMGILMVALTGCIEMKPIPMDTQVGTMPMAAKVSLRVALVTPDPPTHRVMYTPPAKWSVNEKRTPVDQTEQMNESMWPLGRELAKSSRDVFSQVFDQVTSLRQLPMPGEYDLVIQPKINEVHIVASPGMGGPQDLFCDWTMTVLNNKGIPILSKQGATPKRQIVVKASFSSEGHLKTIGRESSEMLVVLVKEWGMMIAESPEVRNHVRQIQKP